MKTISFFFTAFLLLVQSSPAQVRVGFTGGVHFWEGEQSNFYDSRVSSGTGYAVGGILDCPLIKRFSFLIEPTYVRRGTSAQPSGPQSYVSRLSFDLSYLELPILLKYSVGKNLRPFLVLGPTFGFNLSSRVGAEIRGPWFGDLEVEADAGNATRTFECSIEFGGGLSYKADDILTLFIEARYAHALGNTTTRGMAMISTKDVTVGADVNNNAARMINGFKIMCGFMVPL